MERKLQLGEAKIDYAALADLCRRYRVRELSVFGSAARGEMRPDSDIDLLVEFQPDAGIDLIDHAGLMLDLARLLGRKVDFSNKESPQAPDQAIDSGRSARRVCGVRIA